MFRRLMRIGALGRGAASAVDPQDTPLVLTCTTTGAQTLTLQGLTVAAGKTVVVDWGDTNTNTYTAGAGTRTHAYAGAGTYTVKIANRRNITLIDFEDTKITSLIINSTNPLPTGLTSLTLKTLAGLTYNANTNPLPTGLTYLTLNTLAGLTYNANTNPLPTGLTYLTLNTLAGLTYNANTNPLPTGLTYLTLNTLAGLTYNANTNPLPTGLTILSLYTLTGLTWEIKSGAAWPTGATVATITGCPSVTCTAWTDNAIHSIQAENAYSQANVDAFINAIWANKANFTYATPTLDLLGGSNAAPSGTYQNNCPPTSGKEYAYDLVNDNCGHGGPKWVVQTA